MYYNSNDRLGSRAVRSVVVLYDFILQTVTVKSLKVFSFQGLVPVVLAKGGSKAPVVLVGDEGKVLSR